MVRYVNTVYCLFYDVHTCIRSLLGLIIIYKLITNILLLDAKIVIKVSAITYVLT